MYLKSSYKMRRADWEEQVELYGGTIRGSRFQTSQRLRPRSLPVAVKLPGIFGGVFKFVKGRLLRAAKAVKGK